MSVTEKIPESLHCTLGMNDWNTPPGSSSAVPWCHKYIVCILYFQKSFFGPQWKGALAWRHLITEQLHVISKINSWPAYPLCLLV